MRLLRDGRLIGESGQLGGAAANRWQLPRGPQPWRQLAGPILRGEHGQRRLIRDDELIQGLQSGLETLEKYPRSK